MGTSKVSHYLTSADCPSTIGIFVDYKRIADRGGARTLNLLVRSQVLYIPVELRDQMNCPQGKPTTAGFEPAHP